MKRLIVLICFLIVSPLLADDSPLKGARTIFINTSDVHVKRDIQLALKHELPQVRVVSRAKDADLVVEFGGRNGGEHVVYNRAFSTRGPSGSPTTDSSITIASDTSTYDPGHVVAAVRNGDESPLVIHEGMPSPFFANQFAARFIAGWRAANN